MHINHRACSHLCQLAVRGGMNPQRQQLQHLIQLSCRLQHVSLYVLCSLLSSQISDVARTRTCNLLTTPAPSEETAPTRQEATPLVRPSAIPLQDQSVPAAVPEAPIAPPGEAAPRVLWQTEPMLRPSGDIARGICCRCDQRPAVASVGRCRPVGEAGRAPAALLGLP